MKKALSRIIAFSLCFMIIFSVFITVNAESGEYVTIDLTVNGANAKIFGTSDIADEIVTNSTGKATTENVADEYIKNYPSGNLALSGDSGRGGRVVSVLRKDSFEAMKKQDGLIYDSTGVVPFSISTEVDENNGIILGRSDTSAQILTVNAQKAYSKLFVYAVSSLSYTATAVITYEDDTTETKSVQMKGPEWNDANTTTGFWGEKTSLRYNFSNTKAENEGIVVATVSYSNDANRRANIAVIDVNVLKKVKNISLRINDNYGSCAVVGLTALVATDAEINSYYRIQLDDKLSQLPDDVNSIDETNYMAYQTVVEEIESINNGKNILTASELEKIAAVKAKIEEILYSYTPYMNVDFKNSYNAKIWATGGQPTADFSNPEKYIGAYANISSVWVPATNRAMNITAFKAMELADGNIYSDNGVPFKLDYEGGLAFGGRTSPLQSETVYFDGLYADKLHLMFSATKSNDSNRNYKAEILYADNSAETVDLAFKGVNSVKPDNDFIKGTQLYIKDATGTTDNAERYMDILTLETDMSKPLKSITFTTTDQYGGYAVLAITAEILNETEIKADIELKITSVLEKEIAKAQYEINGIYQLVKHYEENVKDTSLSGKAEFETLYMQYDTSVARIVESINTADIDKITAKITFKNQMNKNQLLEKMSVILNGKKTTEFTANYEEKVLEINIENDFDYSKSFEIILPAGITTAGGLGLNNDYKYKFDAIMPIGFENYNTSDTQVSFKFKNYILSSQPYFITTMHLASDGSVKKSHLIKGMLAKGADISKNYSFETVQAGEKLVTYTVDGLTALKSIEKAHADTPVSSTGTADSGLVVNPVDLETNTVKIEGILQDVETVNIVVVNPGVNITADGEYADAIQHQVAVATAENGYYSATVKLNNKTSGEFLVYAGGKGLNEAKYDSFYFASTTAKNSLISNVLNSNNETLIKSKLDEIYLNFGLDKYAPVTLADDVVVTSAILKDAPFAENDFASVQKTIQDASVLDLYNTGKTDDITDSALNFLYDDVTHFSGLDTKYSSTIYSAYNKTLNDAGKKAVIDAITNKDYESIEELGKELLKAIFTKAINMTDRKGVLHIEEILTADNANACGIDISAYFASPNKGKINADLSVSQEYADITALKNAIGALILKYPVVSTPSGGGGGGGVSGGVVGNVTNNSPVIIPVESTTTGFKDIQDAKWAEKAIDYLVNEGIVSGFPDNTFRPYENITREQIVKIICVAMGIEPDSVYVERFTDANYSEWYAPYINAAYKNKIALGREDKTFGIGEGVTRQDLLVMLYRITEEKSQPEMKEFKDSESISDYAKEAVMHFASKNVVSGYEDLTFRPHNICTRAEAVMIIYNYLGGNN